MPQPEFRAAHARKQRKHACFLYSTIAAACAALGACATTPIATPITTTTTETNAAVRAPTLHDSLFTLDTHLDTPASFVTARGFDILKRHDVERDGSQVDVPRMDEGGLDGGFWVIFTPQGALSTEAYRQVRDTALLRALAIHEMVARSPDVFALVTTPDEAREAHAEGKKIVFISIENSYPLGEDLSLLETFYKMGVRMVGPVHTANNQFADSSTDRDGPKHGGLSPLGRELVKEANRLGMVLDASHASDEVLDQMIDLSATPVILSHSGTNDVYDHPRNVPDALLVKLAKSGGVIQMNALGRYLADIPPSPERDAKLKALRAKWGDTDALTGEAYEAFLDELGAINAEYPAQMADFEDYMKQVLHAIKLVGVDHVGFGADWDGGGGLSGYRDITALPKLSERLLAEGYTRDDLQKMWSGNLLRLVQQAQDYAASQKS
ncbi:MAG: dipeptidase [Hyphomonadaceae bacterium]